MSKETPFDINAKLLVNYVAYKRIEELARKYLALPISQRGELPDQAGAGLFCGEKPSPITLLTLPTSETITKKQESFDTQPNKAPILHMLKRTTPQTPPYIIKKPKRQPPPKAPTLQGAGSSNQIQSPPSMNVSHPEPSTISFDDCIYLGE